MSSRPWKGSYLQQEDEGMQKLNGIRHKPEVKSLTEDMQQDDSKEALKRFIGMSSA